MANFEIKDKQYATSLQTGDIFLVQTDVTASRTLKKIDWGRISGFIGDNIRATGTALQNQITNVSGAAPSSNSLTVPVSINVYGNNDMLLGRPAGFISTTVSGISVKIPYYI
jgi:hypothetical protein